MASHRAAPKFSLPKVGRRAIACAAAAPLAMLIGGGVAAADTGSTGGQTAPCHEDVVCAPINAGVNAPIDAGDVLHDGIGILSQVDLHGHH